MCLVCGCGDAGRPAAGADARAGPTVDTSGDLHYGAGPARVSVPGMSAGRAIRLEAAVLGENDRIARANRVHFATHGVVAYNLVSSPGSGKTSLLVATIEALKRRGRGRAIGVIEGDQQTANDANRIRATGVPAIQVNTGKGCHLDAPMVAAAFARLPLHSHTPSDEQPQDHAPGPAPGPRNDLAMPVGADALLFIENVGNLVCPAVWDLGERAKVVILSVTEGEDKPLKYPDLFAAARLMVLNKIDLLPYLDFDLPRCIDYARRVNPGIDVLLLSARSGEGIEAWVDWLLADAAQAHRPAACARGADACALLAKAGDE